MNTPLFSIIIPTYNSQNVVNRALDSLVSQSFKNFEVLVIDGLSKDNTVEVVRNYNDPRIKIRSEKDHGIYDAMNKGIKMAEGEWLYFLGSDDQLYSVDTLAQVAEKTEGVDVVYGNVYSTRFGGLYDGEFDDNKIKDKNICHQAIFLNRKVFQEVGVFEQKYKGYGDWDHNMKWFLSPVIRKKYIDIIVAHYADGGFSSTQFDAAFYNMKDWKYFNLLKRKLSFMDKLRIAKRELFRARAEGRGGDALEIFLQTPGFLL
jgi:glycosyltransferase involved in cell wall biosynthesis